MLEQQILRGTLTLQAQFALARDENLSFADSHW
jgi:hypothetical protein